MKRIFVLSLAAVALLVTLRHRGVVTNVAVVDNLIANLMTAIGML